MYLCGTKVGGQYRLVRGNPFGKDNCLPVLVDPLPLRTGEQRTGKWRIRRKNGGLDSLVFKLLFPAFLGPIDAQKLFQEGIAIEVGSSIHPHAILRVQTPNEISAPVVVVE